MKWIKKNKIKQQVKLESEWAIPNENGYNSFIVINEPHLICEMKWISVKERLPEVGKFILLLDPPLNYLVAKLEKDKESLIPTNQLVWNTEFADDFGYIVVDMNKNQYWMPLPPHPPIDNYNELSNKKCTCSGDPNEQRHTYTCPRSVSKRPFED